MTEIESFHKFAKTALFKTAIILILLPATLWQLSDTFITYIQEPISTIVNVADIANWFVPTITVCYGIPFASFNYYRLRSNYNMSKELFDTIVLGAGFMQAPNDWPRDEWEAISELSNMSLLEEEYGNLMNTLALNATDPLSLLHKMIKHFSADLPIIWCELNGSYRMYEDCEILFTPSLKIERGICATLTVDARKTTEPHKRFSFGWKLTKGDSFIVSLTELTPAMESTALDVFKLFSGKMVVLSLEAKRVKSKKNCQSSDRWTPQYLPINLFDDYAYSIDNCIADLMVKERIEKVQCSPILYQNPDKRERCSIFEFAKLRYLRINESYDLDPFLSSSTGLRQFCKVPCDYTTYSYSEAYYTKMDKSEMVSLTLNVPSPGVFTIEDQYKLSILDWFGQLGNILGLWLGFGFLDIARFLHIAYRKVKQKRSRQKSVSLNDTSMTNTATYYLNYVRSLLCENNLIIYLKQNRLCKLTSRRIITLVCFVVLLIIAAWQGISSIQDYLRNPVRSLIRVGDTDELLFPTITMCPVLPFYKFNYTAITRKYNVSDQLFTIILSGAGFISLNGLCLPPILHTGALHLSDWTILEEEYKLLLKQLNMTELALLEELLNDGAVDIDVSYCEFNGSQVEINFCRQLFTRSLHIQHGICSTFNAKQLIQPEKAFVIEFFNDESHKLNNFAYPICTSGLKLYFTDTAPALQPYYGGKTHYVNRGQSVRYLTRVETTNRLTKCRELNRWTSKYIPDLIKGEKNRYSVENCVADMIIERMFIKALNCVPILYQNPDNLPRCTVFDVAKFSVLVQEEGSSFMLYSPSLDEIADKCPYACGESRMYSTKPVAFDNATENVSRLELLFESDALLRTHELLKFVDLTAWCSHIGGILNLWLNFSFLSLALIAQNIYIKVRQPLPSEVETAETSKILERFVKSVEQIFYRKRRLVVKLQYTVRHVLVTRILLTVGWLVLAGISVWQITIIVLESLQNPTESVVTVLSTNSNDVQYPVMALCPVLPFSSFKISAMVEKYNISPYLTSLIILGSGFLPFPDVCYQKFLSRLFPPESTNWTWLQDTMAEFEERIDLSVFADDLFNNLAMQLDVSFSTDSDSSLDNMRFTPVNSSSWHIQRGLCTVFDDRTQVPVHEQLYLFAWHNTHIQYPMCSELLQIEGSDVYNMLKSVYGQSLSSLLHYRSSSFHRTIIALQKVRSIKNCQRRYSDWTSKYSRTPLEYSLENCVADLIIEKLFAKDMNCIPILYNNPDYKKRCSLFKVAQRSYIWSQNKTISSDFWYWPSSDEVAKKCLQSCEKTFYTFTRQHETLSFLEDSFNVFKFSLRSSDMFLITEQEKLGKTGWLAAIGGILNLWIGFSVLSLATYMFITCSGYREAKENKARVASREEQISFWFELLRYLTARTRNDSGRGQDVAIPLVTRKGKDVSVIDDDNTVEITSL